jgi:fumarylacetoacetate (FAA) hydrolase
MKLATWKDGSRDGQLVVVSRDLATAHYAHGRATTLQQVLDDWNFLSPQLQELSLTLDEGKARHAFAFDPRQCMAPLPRAFLWACAGSPASREDRDERVPPLLPADELLGPCEPVRAEAGSLLCAEPALAAVTGDVDRGTGPEAALEAVRLVGLCVVWRLAPQGSASPRADAVATGREAVLATSFAPVVVTPDELGTAWHGGRLQGGLWLDGTAAAGPDAEAGPLPGLGETLARACRQRRVRAGSLMGVRCSGALALTPGSALHARWRLPDGIEPFGALGQAVETLESSSQRSRFG